MLKLSVPGPPCGKARPHFTRKGIAFTPKKTRTTEAYIRALFVQKYPDHTPFDGPLEMTVMAFFEIPKSASRKNQDLMLFGKIRPTKKPDMSNIYKLAEDALNAVAYRDDSAIVAIDGEKKYDRRPRLEIIIRKPGEEDE